MYCHVEYNDLSGPKVVFFDKARIEYYLAESYLFSDSLFFDTAALPESDRYR